MLPMLATAGTHVPTEPGWTHEVKWDGVRVLADTTRTGTTRLLSRNENPVTVAWPELNRSPLGGRDLLVDGEVIALNERGLPDFRVLQDRMHVRNAAAAARLAADTRADTVARLGALRDRLADGLHDAIAQALGRRREELVDVATDAITLEVTGNSDKLADFLKVIEPFGIRELVQSGLVAIGRGGRSITERTLRRFRRLVDRPVATSTGVLAVAATVYAPYPLHVGRLLRDRGAVFQVPHRFRGRTVVDRRFVELAHASGRHVHVWTVDDRAEMEHLLDLGVDGLITDRTDVCKDVLQRRGVWRDPA